MVPLGLNKSMKKRGSLLFGILGMFAMASGQGFIPSRPQMAIFHQSGYKKLDLTPKQKKNRKKSKISNRERARQR